jgi:hypothetical protein
MFRGFASGPVMTNNPGQNETTIKVIDGTNDPAMLGRSVAAARQRLDDWQRRIKDTLAACGLQPKRGGPRLLTPLQS